MKQTWNLAALYKEDLDWENDFLAVSQELQSLKEKRRLM